MAIKVIKNRTASQSPRHQGGALNGFFLGLSENREMNRGNVRQSKHVWQVRGGRGGKKANIFMFKEKSVKRKTQTNQPKQQNETKPKSEGKRVSYKLSKK